MHALVAKRENLAVGSYQFAKLIEQIVTIVRTGGCLRMVLNAKGR